MRIFFLHPPSNFTETGSYLEPLGLAYVAGAARAAGHEVHIRDLLNVHEADVAALIDELDAFRPELVAISTMSENYSNGLLLAGLAKKRYGCPTVFGGWHVSGAPESVLHEHIDYVVVGEGEETFVELLAHLEASSCGEDAFDGLANIAGLVFARDGAVHRGGERKRLKNLADLAAPIRDGLPMDRYRYETNLAVPSRRMRAASVSASRGCPYKCSFCQTPAVLGPMWVSRAASSVVDEIESLIETYDTNTIFFRDEEFTMKPRAVFALCEELVRRGVAPHISWAAFMRVDDITPDLAAAMAGAGCGAGMLGLEVTDEEQGEHMRKHFSHAEAERALELLTENEIITQGSWIIGFPWDTRERLESAFSWLTSLSLDLLFIFYATPIVGTPLREQAEEAGLLIDGGTEHSNIYDVSIRVPGIDMAELAGLRNNFNRRFYLRPRYAARMAGRVITRPVRALSMTQLVWQQVVGGRFLFSDARPDRDVFRVD